MSLHQLLLDSANTKTKTTLFDYLNALHVIIPSNLIPNHNKTCVLLVSFWMILHRFFYKKQTKNTCHITASKVDYHMTWLAPYNKPLNQLFPHI